jgi:hypothetical protein
MAAPNIFGNYIHTGAGDIGAGVHDLAFQYPFSKPAMAIVGSGNLCGHCPSPVFVPQYFNNTLIADAAQGAGNIQGNLYYTSLLKNFYQNTNPAL